MGQNVDKRMFLIVFKNPARNDRLLASNSLSQVNQKWSFPRSGTGTARLATAGQWRGARIRVDQWRACTDHAAGV